MKSLKYS